MVTETDSKRIIRSVPDICWDYEKIRDKIRKTQFWLILNLNEIYYARPTNLMVKQVENKMKMVKNTVKTSSGHGIMISEI